MLLHSPFYSIPYLIIYMVLFFLYLCEQRKIKKIACPSKAVIGTFIILLLFIGLRGHVYSDFISYYPFFKELPTIDKLDLLANDWLFEPGFVIYSSLLKTICSDYFVWVFINTTIDLFIFRFVFKKYTHSQILPFIFFLAYQGLTIEFNLYRNAKALDLFLLSLPYLRSRKLCPYLILNMIGMTFHASAFLYIFLYFILYRNFSSVFIWLILLLSNIVFLGKIHFLSEILPKVGLFSDGEAFVKLLEYQKMEREYGFSLGYFERTFSIFICFFLKEKLFMQNEMNRIFFNASLCYYFIFMISSDVMVFAERIPLLLIFSYWILFANIFKLRFRLRKLILPIFFLMAFMKLYAASLDVTCRYDNLMWGIEDFSKRESMAMNLLND